MAKPDLIVRLAVELHAWYILIPQGAILGNQSEDLAVFQPDGHAVKYRAADLLESSEIRFCARCSGNRRNADVRGE